MHTWIRTCLVTLVLPLSSTTQPANLLGYILSKDGGKKILHLETPNVDIALDLADTLLSPRYSLWVRNGEHISVNQTVPFQTCHYTGHYWKNGTEILVSLSTCGGEVVGTVDWDGEQYTLVPENREKREAKDETLINGTEPVKVLVLEKSGVVHECGLNRKNKKRLMVEDRPTVRLRRDVPRDKRETTSQLYIELCVFVDDKMYASVENNKAAGEDTLVRIQDIVFAYLNAVQIMYKSSRLSNPLNLVLVRLDILQSPDTSLNTHGGEIESYLESFCAWQKGKNPGGSGSGDLSSDEHWDHALLLTGYNLYDGVPSRDSVIGLAWVSGMCHPDYSCTINEGHNFESVYVIAHEMGHNLGMNHDGEVAEGNRCDPTMSLMSPVLGPGKVTWSRCSSTELTSFLTDSKTKDQALCLRDVPKGKVRYDYSLDGKKPGEKFAAIDQCRQAFGASFNPYVKQESPFEDLCRELWCSNLTHALRAHPALEGTDCSSKPYPYGSICKEGSCSPFSPNPTDAASPAEGVTGQPGTKVEPVTDFVDPGINAIDGIPAWYDPIFTKIFTDLRRTFEEAHPILFLSQSTKTAHLLASDPLDAEGGARVNLSGEVGSGAAWFMKIEDCPVPCGGGWAGVHHLCESSGEPVDHSHCREKMKPPLTKLPCGTLPCNTTLI